MSETYYECPECGKENCYENLGSIPTADICTHCGSGVNFLAVTDDDIDDLVDFIQLKEKKKAREELASLSMIGDK